VPIITGNQTLDATLPISEANVTNLTTDLAAKAVKPVGGDLSGNLPNPTVAKVNGVAVTGTPSVGFVPTATSASAATWQAGGGSQPVIGRPKSSDGTTGYGIPFAGSQMGWISTGFGGEETDLTVPDGDVQYAPFFVFNPIIITAVACAVEHQPGPADTEVHVGVIAATEDWQPVGDALVEETITVPQQDGFTPQVYDLDLDSPVTLQPGIYLTMVEAGPIRIDAPSVQFPGTYICAGLAPGALWSGARVVHAFGPYTSPMPLWAWADVVSVGDEVGVQDNGITHAVMFEWDPA
jgi:hypothetical protein